MKKETKQKKKIEKEFIIMIIIFLVIWRVPLLFLKLGAIWSGLLPVIAFFIAYYIANLIKKRRQKQK